MAANDHEYFLTGIIRNWAGINVNIFLTAIISNLTAINQQLTFRTRMAVNGRE